jgi:hypothetical protein
MTEKFLKRIKNKMRAKRDRCGVFKSARAGELNIIRNLAHALCRGQFPLCNKVKAKLCKDKRIIRDLANSQKLKTTHGLRRKLIIHGGFLNVLIPSVLHLLSSIGSTLISRAIPE